MPKPSSEFLKGNYGALINHSQKKANCRPMLEFDGEGQFAVLFKATRQIQINEEVNWMFVQSFSQTGCQNRRYDSYLSYPVKVLWFVGRAHSGCLEFWWSQFPGRLSHPRRPPLLVPLFSKLVLLMQKCPTTNSYLLLCILRLHYHTQLKQLWWKMLKAGALSPSLLLWHPFCENDYIPIDCT